MEEVQREDAAVTPAVDAGGDAGGVTGVAGAGLVLVMPEEVMTTKRKKKLLIIK
jgi:hypothetical protein